MAAVLFENRPDLLTVKDIEDVLGYSRYCIYRWKEKYGLKSIVVDKKYYFPKKHLLDYIGGAQFHSILYKTEQHIDLLRRAYHEGS